MLFVCTTFSLDDDCINTVKSISFIHNDGIVTLASGGKRKTFNHFNTQIKDLRHMDKKDVDPPRLLFNFFKSDQSFPKRCKRKCKQKKRRKAFQKRCTDYQGYVDLSEALDDELCASVEEFSVEEHKSVPYDNVSQGVANLYSEVSDSKSAQYKGCPRDYCRCEDGPDFAKARDHLSDSDYIWPSRSMKTYMHLSALDVNITECKICGDDVLPQTVELRPVINKNVAEVLYLIENCTAWIHVAKPPEWKYLNSTVSNLDKILQLIEQRIPSAKDDFEKQVTKFEEETKHIIALIRKNLIRA
ncbi:unnamed protein product [Cylicocyclus nassatus]|uniref:Uncharacterized protein n=1 Tax=Cylicocyclus nassatus TaxID=53992 RepID=A0AA36H4C3_CYLNA|nr:unnamed protein product [Cylicocyclus nassatus]